MRNKRDSFGSSVAAVLALAGSAVGLGNIWRFPYMVGENGGALYILVYLLFSLFISLPILYAETIIGRRGRGDTFSSLEKLSPGTGWKKFGYFTTFAAFVILSYYSVVGGWSLDYLVRAATGYFARTEPRIVRGMFSELSSSAWEPILFHFLFMAGTMVIIAFGVKKGIGRASKIMMPALLIMMLAIMVYSLTLEGAAEGIRYLLKPDFSKLSPRMLISAMGQSFFSLSIGMGCILAYSSYMRSEDNIAKTGLITASLDTVIAMIAAFAVIPAVFASDLKPEAGPVLVFETLPFIFSGMGEESPILSWIISSLFFLSLFLAAITSLMSVFEGCVVHLVDKWKMKRGIACLAVFVPAFVLGCLCSLSFGPLDHIRIAGHSIFSLCDVIASNYLMTLGALAFLLFVGWKMNREDVRDEFTNSGTLKANCAIFDIIYFIIRYIAPAMILMILAGLVL